MLFECQYSHFPPLQDLFDTMNPLVLVKNEGIKITFWLSTTLASTYSWGSVQGEHAIGGGEGGGGGAQIGAGGHPRRRSVWKE